ncbi:disulfide bond formation protein DsbB [Sphingobium wenxiniae]|jgi:disulfide bond formation protein DsbB|uniref:Disulfide bond formation protein n=2 Tax=Sphingobium TaxID=165695 RepID=T0GR23_9SPHN|nr:MULTISPECIES: disulfide bond formation protein B [Sphingobium]EQB02433.1 disulfide bond formation protein [Sphingobium baderi LL03]KMS60643.1 disulfide bond formation protein [Sphingobium baderi LL03]MBB6192035.1 disulfide bond formation protein DsbB [Sphingobium wenxiniae]TWH92419.1 disulfide bond formation protein DsbB [Sphingobium wenxiniae]WRD76036.1 disulfide bond formation protein B [Sphingobium baderi]
MKTLPLARALALIVPLALLGGAYVSQYGGGLPPCEMCWWQRYPHMAAIALALAAFAAKGRPCLSAAFTALAALAVGISGGIGIFHAGVEYGWWQGLTACSTSPGGGSSADILDRIMATPITRCDVAPWSLFGISLAGYNGLLSLGAALAILGLLSRKGATA